MVVALLSLQVAVATISAPVAQAQESTSGQSSVLFVVDTSGSMSGSPLSQAKEALCAGIDALAPGQAAGLRSFSGSCGDGCRLLVPVATDNKDQLNAATTQLRRRR
ncbi:VWA domain-containing protein [Rhodococcus sp. WS1]|uniref:VWA domain-containing protein n=1 Tax=unclassified Rhodococcus (in: high G+C Gram-positive bacteria) TaxID=192944 RepID=UPI0011436F65|nr:MULTISPECIES: VWA domain-containing protein [unclassified Rhodococcus (in: high G+C Gram-positive bacteria)]ROZ52973.1 VWA domain-containing protein [Rhodococcus sp. WS1]TQC36065.1 VWA domain-containing protein [Rhodococcus sp. WS7]